MGDDDNLDVIKQIGKGSFSNVYLCKRPVSSIFGLSVSFQPDFFFIVKEINIDALVSKYMKNHMKTITTKHSIKQCSPMVPTITPTAKTLCTKEEDYYYKRLRDLIESEIEVLYMLKHENIIKIFNSTQNIYKYNLHMEYCELGDVYEYSKTIFVDSIFISSFVRQVSEAIRYIHSCNIIHRDIKLQNILVTKSDDSLVFKLSDFGFACYDQAHSNGEDDIISKKYYKLCGTPFYMAPEILLNMKKLENITSYSKPVPRVSKHFYDKNVDLWSFGIALYELIHKTLPFKHIRNIRDLENFYKTENVQEYFDNKTQDNIVLRNLLQIKPTERKLPNELLTDVTNILHQSSITENNEPTLKEHIVSNPIKESLVESWQYIHKSSSLFHKIGVGGGFFEWLMKKS